MRVDVHSAFYGLFVAGCVLLPFSTSPESGGVVSFGMPLFALGGLLILPLLAENARKIDGAAVLFAACFIGLIVASMLFSENRLQSSVRAIVNVVGFFSFLGCLAVVASGRCSVDRLARACLLSCAVLSGYFFVNFAYAASSLGVGAVVLERYVGGAMSLPWGASNTIAQVLLLGFLAYLLLDAPRRRDKLAILILSGAILLTFSRSVSGLMLLMWAVVFGFRRAVFLTLGVAAGLTVLYLTGLLQLEQFYLLLADRLDPVKLMSASGRFDAMSEKIRYFMENPLDPIGYYSSLHVFDFSAHNYWLTTLVEQSLLGALISVLFFGYVWARILFKSGRILLAFSIVMIALMFEDPHFTQPYIMLFWSVLALLVAFERRANAEPVAEAP